MFSISTRLHVNNYRSFFFYFNIFVFRNMTSFGNKRCCLATTACKNWFALYVIHLVARCGVFSVFLVLMYSTKCVLVCYVYIFTFSLSYSCNKRLIDLWRPFSTSTSFLRLGDSLFISKLHSLLNLQSNNQIKKW